MARPDLTGTWMLGQSFNKRDLTSSIERQGFWGGEWHNKNAVSSKATCMCGVITTSVTDTETLGQQPVWKRQGIWFTAYWVWKVGKPYREKHLLGNLRYWKAEEKKSCL